MKQNAKKGEFSKLKVQGRNAIELGAGMGLAGMAFSLLGANVVLTDTTDAVLSLLKRNVEHNLSQASLKLNPDTAWAAQVMGNVSVAELDWMQTAHYTVEHFKNEKSAIVPPFEYILAADCVYNEAAVLHFLDAIEGISGSKTAIIVCNEFRSQSVHDVFIEEFTKKGYTIKKIPMNKMDPQFQHSLIQIFVMKKKKGSMLLENVACNVITGDSIEKEDHENNLDGSGRDKNRLGRTCVENGGDVEDNNVNTSNNKAARVDEPFRIRRQGAVLGKVLAMALTIDDLCSEDTVG